jgi:hypothetical protein
VDSDSADVFVPAFHHAGVQTRTYDQPERAQDVADRAGAADHRTGLSNVAKKPSPIVLISRPLKRSSWRRTVAS